MNQTTPHTLTATKDLPGPAVRVLSFRLTPDGAYRLPIDCAAYGAGEKTVVCLWPLFLETWLAPDQRRTHLIPPLWPKCPGAGHVIITEPIEIQGLGPGEIIVKKEKKRLYPELALWVQGGIGPWYWFLNGTLKGEGKTFAFRPEHPGGYQILVMEQSGRLDRVSVEVR